MFMDIRGAMAARAKIKGLGKLAGLG